MNLNFRGLELKSENISRKSCRKKKPKSTPRSDLAVEPQLPTVEPQNTPTSNDSAVTLLTTLKASIEKSRTDHDLMIQRAQDVLTLLELRGRHMQRSPKLSYTT